MKLTRKVIDLIRKDNRLKAMLALQEGKSIHTIERWLIENDDTLTKAAILQTIKTELKLSDKQILEPTKVAS